MLVPFPGGVSVTALGFSQLDPIAGVADFGLALGTMQDKVHSAIGRGPKPRGTVWAMADAEGMQPITPIAGAAPQQLYQVPFLQQDSSLVLDKVEDRQARVTLWVP